MFPSIDIDSLRVRTPGPAIELGLPPASLLRFPPNPRPATLPAPQTEPSWFQPFNIPPGLYTKLLDVKVPITIAGVYATTVIILNRVNRSRGYKPWGFSQTRLFKLLVVLHNVFLAVYSAWTFAGMIRAFRNSWPHPDDPRGIVAIADSLCHINGPRGYGNAAIFNETADRWDIYNPEYELAEGGVPDPTDVGRLWNQGLAYFGWIFYLSKFYEVLDTAIILAKGKKSSTLQTYHHAGAMMCMWAGIRYVASPIWIFALVNSGIHALMVCPPAACLSRSYYLTALVHVLHDDRTLHPRSNRREAYLDDHADHAVRHWHSNGRDSPFRPIHHSRLGAVRSSDPRPGRSLCRRVGRHSFGYCQCQLGSLAEEACAPRCRC